MVRRRRIAGPTPEDLVEEVAQESEYGIAPDRSVSPREKRDQLLQIRVTTTEKSAIADEATRLGISASDFIRMVVRDRLRLG